MRFSLQKDEKNDKHQQITALFLLLERLFELLLCVKCLCISGNGQPEETGGRGWKVSFGLIWPYFVGGHGKSAYRPEGHAVLGGGRIFFFERGHKCTEETLVALKKSQINNLGPNDSQVWPGRTAICGRVLRWHPSGHSRGTVLS